MSESLSQTIIRMQSRLEALLHMKATEETAKEGHSLIAYVVQIGGPGCYLGAKLKDGKTVMGGVFGIESAERFSHKQAAHASSNLREADGTKSNSGSVVAFSVALQQAIDTVSELISTMEQHMEQQGDSPDFL